MLESFLAQPRRRSIAGSFALLLALLVGSGCYSHHQYTWSPILISGPGWQTYNGQVIWKPNAQVPELTGDLFVAINTNGNAMMQFSKSIPMLTAEMDSMRWQVSVPSQKQSYSGHLPLPTHFAWLQIPGMLTHQALLSPWTFTGGLGDWQINNPKTGESLRGYIALP